MCKNILQRCAGVKALRCTLNEFNITVQFTKKKKTYYKYSYIDDLILGCLIDHHLMIITPGLQQYNGCTFF